VATSLNSINGIGSVKFPNGNKYGSGDVPINKKFILKYDDFINNIELEEDEENESFILEKGMSDEIKSHHVKKGSGHRYAQALKTAKERYNSWYETRKKYYVEKVKNSETNKKKQLLKQQFELEVNLKKTEMQEKLRKHRVTNSKRNLQIK